MLAEAAHGIASSSSSQASDKRHSPISVLGYQHLGHSRWDLQCFQLQVCGWGESAAGRDAAAADAECGAYAFC